MKTLIITTALLALTIVKAFSQNQTEVFAILNGTYSNDVKQVPYNYKLRNQFIVVPGTVSEKPLSQDYTMIMAKIGVTAKVKSFLLSTYVEYGKDNYKGVLEYTKQNEATLNYDQYRNVERILSESVGWQVGIGYNILGDLLPKLFIVPELQFHAAYQKIDLIDAFKYSSVATWEKNSYDKKHLVGTGLNMNVYYFVTSNVGFGLSFQQLANLNYENYYNLATNETHRSFVFNSDLYKQTRLCLIMRISDKGYKKSNN